MNFCDRGYCTCFWDKFLGYVLVPCCKLHDFNYEKQHISRKVADKRLFKCLKKHSFFLLAGAMWGAVRIFGRYFWNKSKREKMKNKNVSNAILIKDELVEHFSDDRNHYLYKLRDDNTLTAWMCCDFEIIDGEEVILRGGCGEGICYNLENQKITLEKGN